jgi:tetratricopeptide (TPR) repeat protein
MSFGYNNLVADYYWLRTISHFGTTEMHAAHYPNLEPLLRRVLALDPYFAAAYHMAGTALTVRGQDFGASIELLKRGMEYRPDDWRIPFYLGFNAFFFVHDYELAASAMTRAAELPGSPPYTGPLAMRLAAEAGQPELGLRLVDAVLATLEDEKLRGIYLDRRKRLLLEQELRFLNGAAARFERQHGRRPTTLGDLVGPGLLHELPERDPLGGSYYIDENGRVQTTNDEERLRLAPEIKEKEWQ